MEESELSDIVVRTRNFGDIEPSEQIYDLVKKCVLDSKNLSDLWKSKLMNILMVRGLIIIIIQFLLLKHPIS